MVLKLIFLHSYKIMCGAVTLLVRHRTCDLHAGTYGFESWLGSGHHCVYSGLGQATCACACVPL